MADIKINDLHPAGSELFVDDESFMNELAEGDQNQIQGGLVAYPTTTVYTTTIRSTFYACTIKTVPLTIAVQ